MKKFIKSIVRLVVMIGITWFIVKYWFGINAPLIKKDSPSQQLLNQRLTVPKGMTVSVYADKLPGARILLLTETGDLLVSQSKQGQIMLLMHDANGDGQADGRKVLLEGLNRPHGIDFYQSWLYIAETDAIGRIRYNAQKRQTEGEYQRIVTNLPGGGNHWSRTLRFGPDDMMYVSIGSSCNVCLEKDSRRATIMRYSPDGKQSEIFASGLRNTVGFDWHPETHEFYGVDNGRDLLGDDFPPCELNRIEQGKFYGWPFVNGNQIPDPDFGDSNNNKSLVSIPPIHEFGAHTAPLSIKFIRNERLQLKSNATALVALHGSWNRSVKSGYKIVALNFDPDKGITENDFIIGFEKDNDVIGRPVDIVEAPEGTLYLSDDFTGSIYQFKISNHEIRKH